MKKTLVCTSNREIYEKLNMLLYSTEVVLKSSDRVSIDRILRTINSKEQILHMEQIGQYIILKRVAYPNYQVLFK
jgi:hypothetical protein